MEVPEILNDPSAAASLLSNYYTETLAQGHIRSGAQFDTWAGGGDAAPVSNQITADDILAASFLSVDFSPKAVIGILETRQTDITHLLKLIPADLELANVSHGAFKSVLGEESPAWELWDLLRGKGDGGWGIGPTKASKLMARKRPRLIPIWDSVVKEQAGLRNSTTQWGEWHELLTRDGGKVSVDLVEIQSRAQLPHPVSSLRALDVVLWMYGTSGGAHESAVGKEDEA